MRHHHNGLPDSCTECLKTQHLTAGARIEIAGRSSAKITLGRAMIARAQAAHAAVGRRKAGSDGGESLCCSPTTLTTLSNHARSMGFFAICNGSRMFSSADNVGTRLNDWKMNPICSRRNRVS